jgi:succinate-semialdehyde dehydrogenase/glutarate-semialdehyde dehydrogenase
LLRATWQIMQDKRESLARLMTLEMGKTLTDANAEVTYSSEFFRWFAEEAVRIGGELRTAPSGANRILTFRQPVGVALLVTPWNFPAAMATRKIAPALAAGCTVVVKPAGETPLTTLYIAALMEQVGVPAGVVNVVTSDRSGEVVDAALEDERVRKISFTGSTAVGRVLLKKAADRVIASSMELGGNDPFLVLADADVDAAVDGAMVAKMRNGGQACTAANRFLVHRDIAEEFATKLAARMGALKMGAGIDEGVELGPMVSEKAVTSIADLVDRSIAGERRRSSGASARTGPASSTRRPSSPGWRPTRRSRPKRSSARSHPSSRSTPMKKHSPSPMPPSTGWPVMSIVATSRTDYASASNSRSAWSDSIAG